MSKIALVLSSLLAALVILPVMLFLAWLGWAHFVQSPRYAASYFDGILETYTVAESRRWHWGSHPWAGTSFGCSYDIAYIPKSASTNPPLNWKADWIETPVVVPDGRYDILSECAYLWSDELVAQLTKASNNPSSYYASSLESLLIYSAKEGIAARMRFGD
jgi:hypothetical protein